MNKLLAPFAALLVLAAAIVGYFAFAQTQAVAADAAAIGSDAPAFSLKNVATGQDISLADYRGKVVVLMFHSIGCPFYKMSENSGYDRVFVPMVDTYKGKEVVFLGINANKNESTDDIKNYLDKHSINYAVLKDEGNKIADAYGAKVTPHIMVIDNQGKLRYRGGVEKRPANPGACGQSDEQYLGPVIDALLNNSELPATETPATGCGIKRV